MQPAQQQMLGRHRGDRGASALTTHRPSPPVKQILEARDKPRPARPAQCPLRRQLTSYSAINSANSRKRMRHSVDGSGEGFCRCTVLFSWRPRPRGGEAVGP